MAMRLTARTEAAPVAVPLVGGALWRLRPATSLDVEVARAEVTRMFAGVMVGSTAIKALSEQFGDLFALGGEVDDARRAAASIVLCEAQLALACSAGWEGVCDADGKPIPEPDIGTVALLLADPVLADRVRKAVNVGVHTELAEKNGSAASPAGGAAAGTEPAPTAEPRPSPARLN